MTLPRMRCALALLLACLTGTVWACDLGYPALQSEALALLRKQYPTERFEPGATSDTIQAGAATLGLQNLRGRLCTMVPGTSAAQRQTDMLAYFETSIALNRNADQKRPTTWAAARTRVHLQFMPSSYLKPFEGKRVLVTRAFAPEVELAVVLDQPGGYVYVREEDRVRWGIAEKSLYETALKNVDQQHKSIRLQGGGSKPDLFLASETKDGYDAVRVLVPWIRQEAAKVLGDPFLAAIPNRDFLIMWGAGNSPQFQASARENVRNDFHAQPYALSPAVLKVWADGRIEVQR